MVWGNTSLQLFHQGQLPFKTGGCIIRESESPSISSEAGGQGEHTARQRRWVARESALLHVWLQAMHCSTPELHLPLHQGRAPHGVLLRSDGNTATFLRWWNYPGRTEAALHLQCCSSGLTDEEQRPLAGQGLGTPTAPSPSSVLHAERKDSLKEEQWRKVLTTAHFCLLNSILCAWVFCQHAYLWTVCVRCCGGQKRT